MSYPTREDATQVVGQETEAHYDRWHRRLDTTPTDGMTPRHAVLISEILGPVDGPYPQED